MASDQMGSLSTGLDEVDKQVKTKGGEYPVLSIRDSIIASF